MLYNCLEWDKRVLTSLDHDRQLYNTFIPPSHESPPEPTRIPVPGVTNFSRPLATASHTLHAGRSRVCPCTCVHSSTESS